MKIKDPGQFMSNAEVLRWAKQKQAQHEQEDAADRRAGITPAQRPPNFLYALEKHERHLASDAYPYERNPSAYGGKHAEECLARFNDERFARVQLPLADKYRDLIRQRAMTASQARKKLAVEQERKELTEAELLMIYNHAPTCVEMLQPMIEDAEERFTPEELEAIVESVKIVFRADELKAPSTDGAKDTGNAMEGN